MIRKLGKEYTKHLINTYTDVQFSVHIAGLFGLFGPANVSPHFIPLHALICKLQDLRIYFTEKWKTQ